MIPPESELRRKSFELIAKQLEFDSFTSRNNLEIVGDYKERREKNAAKIGELIHKGIHQNPDTGSLYTKNLSINCRYCVKGRTQGVHLTDYCSRSCFFCPQSRVSRNIFNRQINYYTPTGEEDRKIIDTMKSNDSVGCGLTGGEPLLVFDKVLHYIRLLKKNLGKDFWIHLYTNGDFLDRGGLTELKQAGLDEIRIDLASIDYSLEKLGLARRYIPRILVEIPVIPHDRERLLGLLPELENLGLDCLNLHELVINSCNLGRMKKKGYQAAGPAYKAPFYTMMNEAPAAGSLELILEVLEFALNENFSSGVHFCNYRARIIKQQVTKNFVTASRICRPHERVTEDGLLEKLVVSGAGIARALEDLEKHRIEKAKIKINPYLNRLEISLSYLDYLNPGQYEVAVSKCLPYGRFTEVSIKVL